MMYQDPKLIVTLKARCHTYSDALKLQAMLSDFVGSNDLAGEHIEECEILYVMPLEIEHTTEEVVKKLYNEIEDLDITS